MKKIVLKIASILSFPVSYVVNLAYNIIIAVVKGVYVIIVSESIIAGLFQLVLFPFVLVAEVLFQLGCSFYVAFCISGLLWNDEATAKSIIDEVRSSHYAIKRKKDDPLTRNKELTSKSYMQKDERNTYDDVDAQISTIRGSFNYQFVFTAIKGSFFMVDFDMLYKNDKATVAYLNSCADAVCSMGIARDEKFYRLKYYFAKGEKSTRSIIIEFEGPWTCETECKFIALIKGKESKCIYTAEYYSDYNYFGLCVEFDDGTRQAIPMEVTNLKSFLELINQEIA